MNRKEKCPVCRKASVQEFRPFCSAGCKDRDLLKWLGEGYRVAGPPAEEDLINNNSDEE